jgi:hypothetical protein
MVVLMGGSGSTGSSLLKNILNRHTSIFAGEESNLFCKKELYDNFNNSKSRITKRGLFGLKNHGWHVYNGIDLTNNSYDINNAQLIELADNADTFTTFIDSLKKHFLRSKEHIWLEKTPANATSFRFFLSHFGNGKVIHITRNPLDTIASLMGRGYSLVYAIGIYLINTSAGLSHLSDPRCLTIKYEDLVANQSNTINSLCDFLNIDFDEAMLVSQNEKIAVSQLPGWQYDETANVGAKSVGRFYKLPVEKQNEILNGISGLCINKVGKELFQLELLDIKTIAYALGYELDDSTTNRSSNLKLEIVKDRLIRIFKRYPTGFKHPLSLA